MIKVKTIAILKGGLSAEHDISKKSAQSVKAALKSKGYNVIEVEVNNEFLSWAVKNKDNVDVFFNALHGQWGEDGKIQGVLEYLGVPYTHSGVTASCLGMDKELSKKIFKNEGIKVPEGKVMTNNQILKKDPFKRPFHAQDNKLICFLSSLNPLTISHQLHLRFYVLRNNYYYYQNQNS